MSASPDRPGSASRGRLKPHSDDAVTASVLLIAGDLISRDIYPSSERIRLAGCLTRCEARITRIRNGLVEAGVLVIPRPKYAANRANALARPTNGPKAVTLWRGGAGEAVPPATEEAGATAGGPIGPLAGTIRELRALERRRRGLLGTRGVGE
jgi:hypothetical protein